MGWPLLYSREIYEHFAASQTSHFINQCNYLPDNSHPCLYSKWILSRCFYICIYSPNFLSFLADATILISCLLPYRSAHSLKNFSGIFWCSSETRNLLMSSWKILLVLDHVILKSVFLKTRQVSATDPSKITHWLPCNSNSSMQSLKTL